MRKRPSENIVGKGEVAGKHLLCKVSTHVSPYLLSLNFCLVRGPFYILMIHHDSEGCLIKWLERLPCEGREVVGSNSGHGTPESLKLVVVTCPLGAQDYGVALQLARQRQDNGLVNYWLKILETWICELSPLNN